MNINDIKILEVSARKGGVGTSTVAVSLAVTLSQHNAEKVLLIDPSAGTDAFAIAGLPVPEDTGHEYLGDHKLTVRKTTQAGLDELLPLFITTNEFVVIDAGRNPQSDYSGVKPFRISVVTNSYLSLRAHCAGGQNSCDAVVCLFNSGHALTKGDVQNVVGNRSTVHFFEVSDTVARSIDAGLYAVNRSHLFSDWTSEFLKHYDFIQTASATLIGVDNS